MDTQNDGNGNIMLYSPEDFIRLFYDEKRCIICGVVKLPGVEFNEEHIIPKWILKRYNLFHRKITFPSDTLFSYGKYTIPICKQCNQQLAEEYETPISKLFSYESDTFFEGLKKHPEFCNGIFLWLNLIFLKNVVSKRQYRYHLDFRKGNDKIADFIDLESLYHNHILSRVHLTRPTIYPEVIGSIYIGKSNDSKSFDFLDNVDASTIMLKLGEKFVIAVLDDSGIAIRYLYDAWLPKIQNEKLNNYQIRELFVQFTYLSLIIKEKPNFESKFDLQNKIHESITLKEPIKIDLIAEDECKTTPGKLLAYYLKSSFSKGILEKIEKGEIGFIFDKDGNFFYEEIDSTNW